MSWIAIAGCDGTISNPAAVVSPVQQRLPLARAAVGITWVAVLLHLRDVAANLLPAPDLAAIFLGQPAAHVVAAVPLKPAARVVLVDPALAPPRRKRLARIDAEVV